jgi:serine/threonine protein kinase
MMSSKPGEILLGNYQVEAWLGRGTFSEAYQVTNPTFSGFRTLKVLRSDIPGLGSSGQDSFFDRFQYESRLSQIINPSGRHTNLVQVYEVQRASGLLALEREYAPGGSLAGVMAQARASGKPLSMVWSIKMVLEVADALSVLHTHGVVHSNLKPRNILFSVFHEVKLSDLYLAQSSSTETGLPTPTSPVPFSGPVGYMSPEQEHLRHKLQPASDVYSLGMIFFELLTGSSYAKVPPGSPPSNLRSDLPQWLDELVAHMLSQVPGDRPYDGAVLAALLRAGLDHLGRENLPEVAEDVFQIHDFKPHEHLNVDYEPQEHRSGELSFVVPLPNVPPQTSGSFWEQMLELLKMLVKNPAFAILGLVILAILVWVVIEVFFIR